MQFKLCTDDFLMVLAKYAKTKNQAPTGGNS